MLQMTQSKVESNLISWMKDLCSGKGVFTISTDSMDLAGHLVQSLGTYLGIEVSVARETILGGFNQESNLEHNLVYHRQEMDNESFLLWTKLAYMSAQ